MLDRAADAGVRTVLVPGVEPAQWARAETLDGRRTRLLFAVGLHPQVVDLEGARETQRALDALEAWVDRLGAVAIGELGWDKRSSPAALDRQSDIADVQLTIARRRGLPVILHVVGAHSLALDRLARHAPLRGVVHAYSGAAELVPRYVELGLSISFGPSITRPSARRPLEAAKATPRDRLLVETDSPDQFPFGRESRRGEPADVALVADAVARARGESAESVASAAAENATRLFG